MERTQIPDKSTQDQANLYEHLFENALGVPVILSSAPTTAGGQLSPNQMGFYGGNLYFNIQDTIYRISLTAV